MSEERKVITPSDLKEGQVKVVVYSYKGCTIIVPDPEWNRQGDLSKLPPKKQKVLCEPNKNGIKRYQRVIGRGTHSTLVPSGTRVIDEIAAKGYSECNRRVSFGEHQ